MELTEEEKHAREELKHRVKDDRQERINSLLKAFNAVRFNPNGYNFEVGKYNFEIMLPTLQGIAMEYIPMQKEDELLYKEYEEKLEQAQRVFPIRVLRHGTFAIEEKNLKYFMIYISKYEMLIRKLIAKENSK